MNRMDGQISRNTPSNCLWHGLRSAGVYHKKITQNVTLIQKSPWYVILYCVVHLWKCSVNWVGHNSSFCYWISLLVLNFFLYFSFSCPPPLFFVRNILGAVVLNMYKLLQNLKNFQCLQVNLHVSLILCLLLISICFNAIFENILRNKTCRSSEFK